MQEGPICDPGRRRVPYLDVHLVPMRFRVNLFSFLGPIRPGRGHSHEWPEPVVQHGTEKSQKKLYSRKSVHLFLNAPLHIEEGRRFKLKVRAFVIPPSGTDGFRLSQPQSFPLAQASKASKAALIIIAS
ncbi:hypothetical protein THAOC_21545 [Thalassiosira oceanica]|uniref:Uncharacterized protein n=1 Tax=Thalassiosira oceanica TaxID=159749 RepID=K0SIK9_THAOC|nr:hypothetical protein THAOC_21545 [Thalassiosira oceanica]|eukprot:EJK58342.1 hypothetical protein THAOC_21545 [Thalassiosira oceanica]